MSKDGKNDPVVAAQVHEGDEKRGGVLVASLRVSVALALVACARQAKIAAVGFRWRGVGGQVHVGRAF